LSRAGVGDATVILGDGYAGAPGDHFDRVIVTVGVAGISPRWLSQLTPTTTGPFPGGGLTAGSGGGGLAVVPVEHAGMHPVLAVRGAAGGPVTARVVCPSGFMSAAGPLTADHAYAHPLPAPVGLLGAFTQVTAARWDPPLGSLAYRDLWYAAGVWHRRASHAALRRDQSSLALLDETRTGGAIILPSGAILAGGDQAGRYAADAVEILDRWEAAGRPPMQAWHVVLTLTGDPDAPIWVPAEWSLG
jgi:protein-L-isoaspartate(D-aspartate) O-methyltransferase